MLKAIYFLFEELVRKCVGQAQVSVKDEIVLVSKPENRFYSD